MCDSMNMNFQRNNDLTNVFNQRWNANHGNNEKVQQAKKDFNYKMFGIRDKEDIRREMREANSVSSKVNNLNQKMDAVKAMNNIGKMNNMRNNFR